MGVTIDQLQIEIQSNSTNATQGIDELAVSLANLKKNGKITTVVKNLNNLSKAIGSLPDVYRTSSQLQSLAHTIEALKSVGTVAALANSLTKLTPALRSLETVNLGRLETQARELSDALSPLMQLKGSGFASMVNAMAKIEKVTESLDSAKIKAFADKMKELSAAVEPFSGKMETIATAFRGLNTAIKQTNVQVDRANAKVNVNMFNFANLTSVLSTLHSVFQSVAQGFANVIDNAAQWEGIASRFGRGFGAQAQETYEWIQRLNEEMGLNVQQFMQFSSVYATMLTGFGVANEDASKMALGYTELTYDIWAGYNDIYKTFDEAAEAVRSAIAGEVEPVRRAGFTIIESTLEQTAANHGLEISIENATEAQKSYLRYLTLVDQAHSQSLVGTYAKEMNTAEGVMRTFSQQLKSLTQAFGSLFLPILVRVMPWLQAFVELLTEAVHRVAEFFGVEIQPIDWSGYNANVTDAVDNTDGVTGALNDATKAAKELKNATLGIDELNVISPSSSSVGGVGGGSGGGSVGGGFAGVDIDSLWDDSIFDNIQSNVDEIKNIVSEALADITAVISGFLFAVGTILVVTGANIPLGLGMMAVGAVGLAATVVENWNTMSDKLAKTLSTVTSIIGGFTLTIGAFLAFSGVNVPLGLALMVAGAVSLATAATINWKFLNGDMKNTLANLTSIVGGSMLALGALFAFTGVAVPMGIALMVAGAVSITTAVGLNWNAMTEPVRKAVGAVEAVVGGMLLTFGSILAFSGANIPLGIGLIAAGAVSLASAVAVNWNSLTGDLKNTISTITAIAGGALLGIGLILALTGVGIPLGIGLILAGATGLVSTAAINWKSITESIRSVLKEIGIIGGASLLALGLLLLLTGVGIPLGIGLVAAGAAGLASGIALNWDAIVNKVKEVVAKIGAVWDILWAVCSGGIKKMYDGVVAWFTDLWDVLVGHSIVPDTINAIISWFTSLPSKIFGSIEKFVTGIVDKFKGLWSKLVSWWNGKTKLKEYTPSIGSIYDKLKERWDNARTWWNDKKTKAKEYTPSIGSIYEKVYDRWKNARDWWNSKKGSFKSYTPSIGSIVDKVKSAWSSAKSWWSKNVGGLSTKLDIKVPKLTVNWGEVSALGKTFRYPKSFSLKFAANGGIFDQGSLIWAGERGPEVMAKAAGGKTGVMNVQQMQDAVYEGVYSAVVAAMRGTNGGGSQEIRVYLDGREISSSVRKHQHESGATIMGNEVYAY